MILIIIALIVWLGGMFLIVVIPFIDPPRSGKLSDTKSPLQKKDPIDYLSKCQNKPSSHRPPTVNSLGEIKSVQSLAETFMFLNPDFDVNALKSLLKKYPEFSDGKFYDTVYIDGKWRNIFKENVSDEMKIELKRILPKWLYDQFNYQSRK